MVVVGPREIAAGAVLFTSVNGVAPDMVSVTSGVDACSVDPVLLVNGVEPMDV